MLGAGLIGLGVWQPIPLGLIVHLEARYAPTGESLVLSASGILRSLDQQMRDGDGVFGAAEAGDALQ